MKHLSRREFLAAGAAGVVCATALGQDAEKSDLVVHEWGVITVPYGATWAALRTEGATGHGNREHIAGLPAFVATWEKTVGNAIEKWEKQPVTVTKPIVYFYSKKRTPVTMKVSVPTGRPSAWFPPADDYGPKPVLPHRHMRGFAPKPLEAPPLSSIKPEKGYLTWTHLVVDPEAEGFPKADGWWAKARETDASAIRSGTVVEKFVYYDALIPYDPGLKIEWKKDGTVTVRDNPGTAFAIRVKGGKCRSAKLKNGSTRLVEGEPGGLREALLKGGLNKREADGLIAIWRQEWFRIDGARVIVVQPQKEYDRLLPIEISPKPAELRRVLLTHIECLDPETMEQVRSWIDELGSAGIDERDRAAENLRKMGARAESLLREASEQTDVPEVKARILDLLKALVR